MRQDRPAAGRRLVYRAWFWLAVVYPVMAALAGASVWLLVAEWIPQESHPVLYGAGTGLLCAAFWYHHWLRRHRDRG